MKVLGIVAEYNPFHNGHKYHLEKSKLITGCDFTVAIMSGNFVQRGEPAIVDKWTRAKMAIDNGVDLVIELPFMYSCSSAEFFAYGAIKILNSLGIIDYISFGSELGEVDTLENIANILVKEPEIFRKYLKIELNKGIQYPKARNNALKKFFQEQNSSLFNKIDNIISTPNNILAIEYLKSIKKLNSNIIPITIKRKKANYNSYNLTGNISSANAIRNSIKNNKDLNIVKETLPNNSYNYMVEFYNKYGTFNYLDNYQDILLYLIRTSSPNYIKHFPDVNEGLENRIYNYFQSNDSLNNILDFIKTKRYTFTRLKRILINILVGLDKDTFDILNTHGPQYIRVLGCNAKGIKILNNSKNKNSIPIITKFSQYKQYNNDILNNMIMLDKKSTDIYFLGLKKNTKNNLDYYTTPYIKLD